MRCRSHPSEIAVRVFDGGRFHYRFACPNCGQPRMYLAGMSVVRDGTLSGNPEPLFTVNCSECGSHRSLRSLPITGALICGEKPPGPEKAMSTKEAGKGHSGLVEQDKLRMPEESKTRGV